MANRIPTSQLRIIYLTLLFCVWFVLVGSLLRNNYFKQKSTGTLLSLKTGIRDIPTDAEWMIIKHNGQKLGYAVNSIQNLGDKGYSVSSTFRMNTALAGVKTKLAMHNRVTIDTLFRLKTFNFRLQSDMYTTQVKGVKSGSLMDIQFIHGNDTTSQKIEVPEDLYTYIGIQPMITWQGFQEGDRLTIPAFDPMSMEMADVEVTHEGKKELVINGKIHMLNKIRANFKGIPSILWLDDNGLTYREESIMGLVMERTTSEEALALEAESGTLDLINVYSVPVKTPIRDVANLSELKIKIGGIDASILTGLNSYRQEITSEEPLIVTLRRSNIPEKKPNFGPYLASSPVIQCENSRIIDAARKITTGAETTSEQVKYLVQWVYDYLEKLPVVSLSAATDILDGRKGDCTEHTTLFTSLSRSINIPTKINAGLVYLNGKFLYHAWPSVYINGEWISVDPTLGQPIADVTHLAIVEGDFTNFSQLVTVLGRITIEVVDMKYEDKQL